MGSELAARRSGARRMSLPQALLFLLRKRVVLLPSAMDRLALLRRHIFQLLVAVAHLRALLRAHAGPLLHARLQPFLLLRRHLGIALRDLDPLASARPLDLWPFVSERRKNMLLLCAELLPFQPPLLCCALSRVGGYGQPKGQ